MKWCKAPWQPRQIQRSWERVICTLLTGLFLTRNESPLSAINNFHREPPPGIRSSLIANPLLICENLHARQQVDRVRGSWRLKPEVAAEQIQKDSAPPPPTTAVEDGPPATGARFPGSSGTAPSSAGGATPATPDVTPKAPVLRRFRGSTQIDATRLSRDVDLIASSVVQHLAGLLDAMVKITIEIEAEIPSGTPENVVRTVTENCRTLKFENQGFEEA